MFEIGDNVLISRAGGYPWIDSMNFLKKLRRDKYGKN